MLSFLYGVYSMIKRPDTLTVVHIGLKTLYRYKFLFYVLVLILLLRFRARGGGTYDSIRPCFCRFDSESNFLWPIRFDFKNHDSHISSIYLSQTNRSSAAFPSVTRTTARPSVLVKLFCFFERFTVYWLSSRGSLKWCRA